MPGTPCSDAVLSFSSPSSSPSRSRKVIPSFSGFLRVEIKTAPYKSWCSPSRPPFAIYRTPRSPSCLERWVLDLAETETKPPPSRAFPSPLWSKQNPWVSSREAPLCFCVLDSAFGAQNREISRCRWARLAQPWRHRAGGQSAGRPPPGSPLLSSEPLDARSRDRNRSYLFACTIC